MAWIKKLVGFVSAVLVVAGCSKTEQPRDAETAVLYGPPPRFDENPTENDGELTQDDIDALNNAGNFVPIMPLYGMPIDLPAEENPENDGEPTQDDIDTLNNAGNFVPIAPLYGMPIDLPAPESE